jgi:hypothetical protein
MDVVYMDGKRKAGIGDLVMTRGNTRCIVIDVEGTFIKILGIGTHMETGETFVLMPRYIDKVPASDCHYMEKQTLNI